MDRYEARKAMVEDLKEQGLLVKVVPHSHNVGIHDRCKTTVEPMVKPQWFVKMDEMAKPAIEAVKDRRAEIRAGELRKDVSALAGGHPRLVYLQTALVGPPDPGLLLRRLRRDDCGARQMPETCPEVRLHALKPGRGHAGYLVLLGALALLHAGLAGKDARSWSISIRQTCW